MLLTNRLLEDTAGEWRYEFVCSTPTGRSTWRSQKFASRLEAESEMMAALAEKAWTDEVPHLPAEMLPDTVLARAGLEALRNQGLTEAEEGR